MTIRIATAPVCALTRLSAVLTTFASQRWLIGLALTCLLAAGCLTSGAGLSLAASDGKASSKSNPRAGKPAPVRPTIEIIHSNETPHSNSDWLKRRRLVIAEMLERSLPFRTILDVKLLNAKLAGPFERKFRNFLFSSETHTETLYCASAQLDVPWIHPIEKFALIRVGLSSNGSEQLYAKIPQGYSSPLECGNANYGPFPEMEQARSRRRRALGKSD